MKILKLNVWDTSEVILTGIFTSLNSFIRRKRNNGKEMNIQDDSKRATKKSRIVEKKGNIR